MEPINELMAVRKEKEKVFPGVWYRDIPRGQGHLYRYSWHIENGLGD